jgi:hypothetical protein
MTAPLPYPLRPDPSAARSAAVTSLARAAIAASMAALDRRVSITRFAERTWPNDRDVPLLLRAAVPPASTTSATTLTHIALHFFASLVPVSAGAQLLNRGLQLTFDHYNAISLPGITAITADFVGQGQPIPVVQPVTSAVQLLPYKIAVSVDLTGEMIRNSNAEAIVGQRMLDATGPAIDANLFSSAAGVPEERPPGLLNGIPPLTGATGGGQGALTADLKALANALAPVAGNSQIVLVVSAEQAVSLALQLRSPFPVLTSASLAPGTVIAVAVNALVSAIDAPEISASQHATPHEQEQPSPLVDIGGGIMATPVRSMFQTDSVSLRLIMNASWVLRSPSAIAWIQNATW